MNYGGIVLDYISYKLVNNRRRYSILIIPRS